MGWVLSHELDIQGDGGGGTMMEPREEKWREGRRKKVEDEEERMKIRPEEVKNKHNRAMKWFGLPIKSSLIQK